LDIAEGLKQLLNDAEVTIDSVIGLGYRELSEIATYRSVCWGINY
jgi:hypothetical protein